MVHVQRHGCTVPPETTEGVPVLHRPVDGIVSVSVLFAAPHTFVELLTATLVFTVVTLPARSYALIVIVCAPSPSSAVLKLGYKKPIFGKAGFEAN